MEVLSAVATLILLQEVVAVAGVLSVPLHRVVPVRPEVVLAEEAEAVQVAVDVAGKKFFERVI